MNLFQEMEVNYKDFIESANDFMDSCKEYTNINEDEILDNIQILKFFHDKCISEKSIGMMQVYRVDELAKAIEEVLNFIGKQQKEIEALKLIHESYKEMIEENKKYIIKMTDEQYSKVIGLVELDTNKKWEDKIKAKIKELEKLNDESTGIGYWFAIYYLQSLLEKE